MNVFYTSDGEHSGFMKLDALILNFDNNDGWSLGYNEIDMRDELESRGWYEGLHASGRYLVLNLDKLLLQFTTKETA